MKVTLTKSNIKGWWRISHGERILFTGGRVEAKKFASDYCRANGIPAWWNLKKRGVWAEITVTLAALLTLAATASAAQPSATEVVAAVIVAEAGGEGYAGMRAVREVIQMRAYERQQTERAVVTAPKQFSCLNRTTPERLVAAARRSSTWNTALTLASRPVDRATVWQANHYHALTVRPKWAAGQRPVAITGGHAFYRL